jgi:hypothetical protein
MERIKHALYLAGHVDSIGNISDPIFIRYLSELPNSEDVPKNCFAVSQSFDGMYWSSCSDEVHPDYHEGWLKGDFCCAVYFSKKKRGNIDYFFCELTDRVSIGNDYVSGILYNEIKNKLYLVSHPKYICVADISDIY